MIMNLPELFKKLLLNQKKNASPLTVKNYLSDLRQFISWYEDFYKKPFTVESLTEEVYKSFNSITSLSLSSKERRMSAIRKFLTLLEDKGLEVKVPKSQTDRVDQKKDERHPFGCKYLRKQDNPLTFY